MPSAIGCIPGGPSEPEGHTWGASDSGRPPLVPAGHVGTDGPAAIPELRGLPVLRCVCCFDVSLLFVFLHLKNMYLGGYNGKNLTDFQA